MGDARFNVYRACLNTVGLVGYRTSETAIVELTMERFLAWKILPRLMMFTVTFMYIRVIEWFISLPPEAMTSQATALTATVTGAMTGAFAVWLGSERK